MSGNNLVLFFISVFFLLSSLTIKSQEVDSLYYTDPDRRIAEMIFNKRIVMLGENPHSHPIGHRGVIKILNEWLNQLISDTTKPKKLILILETDSASASAIENYFESGVIDPIVDASMPIENYEFYTDLRYIHEKIDSINKANNSTIEFNVRGFEEIGGNFEAEYFLKKQKEQELWFINEREIYTSNGIINYLKKYPEERALIFYGSAHLIKGFIDKNQGFSDLTKEECMGYFLIHYLEEGIGKENIIEVLQPVMQSPHFMGTPFEKILNTEVLVYHDKVTQYFGEPYNYDYFVFRPFRYSTAHHVGYIFSRATVEKCLKTLKQCEPVLSGYIGQRVYNRMLNYLWILTGNKFQNSDELENWYAKNGFDGFAKLYSKDFDEQIFNEFYSKTINNKWFRFLLNELGFSREILDINYKPDTLMWKDSIWPEMKKGIIFLNSIGIYWFGYPDEKIKAKEYLVKFSGEDYAEPEKYLQWYRMKYYGYEF